ncbi:uncharacterized protein LOC131932635 [Physella acuta]|uniref:uncharacterized protein LOC131932635 n=1 Tax=Physella acuta TaxID=109671 RepID=UPI0027DE4FEA|nr:uncharacterized protein LOC131932635 [Physella acuta]
MKNIHQVLVCIVCTICVRTSHSLEEKAKNKTLEFHGQGASCITKLRVTVTKIDNTADYRENTPASTTTKKPTTKVSRIDTITTTVHPGKPGGGQVNVATTERNDGIATDQTTMKTTVGKQPVEPVTDSETTTTTEATAAETTTTETTAAEATTTEAKQPTVPDTTKTEPPLPITSPLPNNGTGQRKRKRDALEDYSDYTEQGITGYSTLDLTDADKNSTVGYLLKNDTPATIESDLIRDSIPITDEPNNGITSDFMNQSDTLQESNLLGTGVFDKKTQDGKVETAHVNVGLSLPVETNTRTSESLIQIENNEDIEDGELKLNFELKSGDDFVERLSDSKSPEFTEAARRYSDQLSSAYENVTDFKRIEILGFRPGSTLIDYNVILQPSLSTGFIIDTTKLKTDLERVVSYLETIPSIDLHHLNETYVTTVASAIENVTKEMQEKCSLENMCSKHCQTEKASGPCSRCANRKTLISCTKQNTGDFLANSPFILLLVICCTVCVLISVLLCKRFKKVDCLPKK